MAAYANEHTHFLFTQAQEAKPSDVSRDLRTASWSKIPREADTLFLDWFRRWDHQLPNGLEHDAEMFVVVSEFAFDVLQLAGQVLVSPQDFAELDKGAHDGDVDLDGPIAAEDTGKHSNALLGEGVREISTTAADRRL
jgi:hypothetical protein